MCLGSNNRFPPNYCVGAYEFALGGPWDEGLVD
jgi:hypothetical protein